MSIYAFALFLHIVGALGICATLGLEWTGLRQIRNAVTLDLVRSWMGILRGARSVGFAAMLTTVITGFYMMLTYWGGAAWIIVTLGSLVLVIALAMALSGPRMAAVGAALRAEKGAVSETLRRLASHPLLSISIQTRVAIVLGIVFLKIAKPGWGGSLLTTGVAVVLGLATALPVPQRKRAQEGAAD